MITQTYNLNLIPDKVPVIVNASQYDNNSRTILFNLYNGGTLYTIPSGAVITVRGTKPDKTGFEYQCEVVNNQVSFEIQEQITVLSGMIPSELRITLNNEILGTCNFIFNIEKTTLDDDTIISETQLPLLESAEQNAIRAEAAADRAEQASSNKMDYVSSPTANDILLTDANGQAIDSGTNLTSINNLINSKQDILTAGTGIDISNNVISDVMMNATTISSGDINNITEAGIYYVNGVSNLPNSASNGILIVIKTSARSRQIFFRYGTFNTNNNEVFTREVRLSDNVGSDWVRLIDSKTFTYKAGDTLTLTNYLEIGGLIGSSATNIYFTIPVGKPITANSVSVNALYIALYQNGTRLMASTDVVGSSTVTTYIDKGSNSITVRIQGLTVSNIATNSSIVVEVNTGTVFTFS